MLHDWNGECFLFKTSGQGRTLGWTSSPGEFSSFCPIRFLTMNAVQSWVANLFHFLPTGILKFVTWVLGSNLFRRPNELHWLTPGHLEKMWRWNHLNIILFPSEIMSQNDFIYQNQGNCLWICRFISLSKSSGQCRLLLILMRQWNGFMGALWITKNVNLH